MSCLEKIKTMCTRRDGEGQGKCKFCTGSLMVMLFLTFIFAVSCMDIRVRVGVRPDQNILEGKLIMGESTRSDIIKLLGLPYGKGQEMLPIRNTVREMWTYYYEEGSLEDDRRIFLFIFLEKDHYDGYMWFSSLPTSPKANKL